MASPTLFTTYLKMLGVPHTATYSDREYKSYPPRLAFMAFQDLLYEYRIDRHLTSGEATGASLRGLRLPCVAAMADGTPRIITAIDGDTVHYTSCKGDGSMPLSGFLNNWSGKSIEAGVTGRSAEPEWRKHRLAHVAAVTEHYAFWLLTAALALFFFFYNGLYSSWSMTLLTLLYALGTMVCWMLTLKQNNVRSASAEAVCSMLQPHGCSSVVNSDMGSLFGLFHWSEIGLAYFSVSLGAVLLHPASVNYLGYISILCLPYTLWSVYTQHRKLHSWCTLCLTVQLLFWLIFGVSLGGGHIRGLLPLRWNLAVLMACYALALLLYHKIVPAYFDYERRNADDGDSASSL